MGTHRPRGRSIFITVSIAGAALVLLPALQGNGPAHAEGADPLVAGSVCEAHELRAMKAEDPDLQIQIPKEFDKPFPSRSACQSHDAAWDPEAEGPLQPIPFSHKHHAGDFGIDCLYCHSGTDGSRNAGVPSVQLCMGCHSQFPKEYDELEGIRILKDHWKNGKAIEWVQIHRLPEYVKFQHQAHVRPETLGGPGFDCQTCHGPVETMDKLSMTPDTKFWQYGLPTQKLEMGWCVMCHRDNGASQDCLTCHY